MSELILIRDRLHMVRATLQGMLSDPAVSRTIDLTPEIRQCDEALAALERLAARYGKAMPIIAALAIYGDRVDVLSLAEKARELNEAQP